MANMAHAHCMLDTAGYKHALRVCNSYCFPLQRWLHERFPSLRYSTLPHLFVFVLEKSLYSLHKLVLAQSEIGWHEP